MKLSKVCKLPVAFYVVLFLFICVIFMSSYAGIKYSPYKKESLFSREYPYEGFSNHFPEVSHNAASVETEESVETDTKGVLGIFEADGLKASAVSTGNQSIDMVSKLKGSPECVGSSMGYSNSKGGLCWTPELMSQFSSRGGNLS